MSKKLLDESGLRLDGRRKDQLRRIRCKLGVYTAPDGSAYIEQGLTKVLVAVYGPHQGKRSKTVHDAATVNCQYSMAVFSTTERKRRPHGDRKSIETSILLKDVLSSAIKTDLYPRSQIDIYFEVLEADGGNLAACINGATLALIDAGIALHDYVCACTAGLADNEIPMMDMSHREESAGGPTLTVACLPRSGKIVLREKDSSRRFHVDYLEKIIQEAIDGCKQIFVLLDDVVRQHVIDIGSASGWAGKQSGISMNF